MSAPMDRDLYELLLDCEEYFDNRADADITGYPPVQVTNKEYVLLQRVRAFLKDGQPPPPEEDAAQNLEDPHPPRPR